MILTRQGYKNNLARRKREKKIQYARNRYNNMFDEKKKEKNIR